MAKTSGGNNAGRLKKKKPPTSKTYASIKPQGAGRTPRGKGAGGNPGKK